MIPERPILLDLFCGAGGAARGYQQAGFFVIGVDLAPQKNYAGDEFIQRDALEVLTLLLEGKMIETSPGRTLTLLDVSAIHASPPCQFHSDLRSLHQGNEYLELIAPTRELLLRTGKPYVIENVARARKAMIEPIVLCGSMFGNGAGGRQLRRHRLFESNVAMLTPECRHEGQPVGVYGHGGGGMGKSKRGYKGTKAEYEEAMEMPWATKAEIAQAIPPSYSRWIGAHLMQVVNGPVDLMVAQPSAPATVEATKITRQL